MNKNLLLLVVCLSILTPAVAQITATTKAGNASDCSEWIETTVDRVDGTEFTAIKEPIIVSQDGKTGFVITCQLASTSPTLIVVIAAVGAGRCVDEGDEINVLFRDGSRMTLFGQGKFNCERRSTVYFGGNFGKNKQELKDLAEKQIETVRVWTTDSFVERDFSPEQSIAFQNVVRCLSKLL